MRASAPRPQPGPAASRAKQPLRSRLAGALQLTLSLVPFRFSTSHPSSIPPDLLTPLLPSPTRGEPQNAPQGRGRHLPGRLPRAGRGPAVPRLCPGCPQASPAQQPEVRRSCPQRTRPEALPGASGGSAEPPGAAPSRGSRSSGPGPWGGKGRRGRSEAAASLPGSAGGGSRRLAPTGRARPGPPGAGRLGTARLSPLLLPLLPLQARPERHLEAAGSSQGETGHPALAPRAFLTSAPSCAAPGRATTARGDRHQHRALCCFPRWIRDLSLTTAFLREK